MPISGIGSYAPTMQEFINHWTAVNASLGATPLTLRKGYTLANFTTDRTNIINAMNAVITADNTAQTTSGTLAPDPDSRTRFHARPGRTHRCLEHRDQ